LVIKTKQPVARRTERRSIRLGFVPLNDAAPLIMAQELDLFEKHGVRVALQRELGWATIRDKIIYGELEAAHALAAMPFAATLGFGSIRCECLTALILSLNGNAITLSEDLWKSGIRDSADLVRHIRQSRSEKKLTFGIVHRFSTHRYLLAKWLAANGIDSAREIRMVVLPPSQMVANLASGNLDAFCVGEPWNSVAIAAGKGWCVETSESIDPGHPEKVLMVRQDFAEKREGEHLALLAALLEACAFCDVPENAEKIAIVLARPQYVGASAEALLQASAEFNFGHGRSKNVSDFCVFHRSGANDPDLNKASWIVDVVRGALSPAEMPLLRPNITEQVFRSDIFARASRFLSTSDRIKDHENENKTELQAA